MMFACGRRLLSLEMGAAGKAGLRFTMHRLRAPPLAAIRALSGYQNVRVLSPGVHKLMSIRQLAELIVKVPRMAESITEGTLETINKQVGDKVNVDETLAVIETDKTSVDVNAPVAGVVKKVIQEQGATVCVGDQLFVLETEEGSGASASESSGPMNAMGQSPPGMACAPFGIGKMSFSTSATPSSAANDSSIHAAAAERQEKVVPMSRLRLKIAQRLKHAQNTAACLTTLNECEMGSLMAFRNEVNKVYREKHGIKLGFVSAFLYAMSRTMVEMPEVNGYISEDGKNIIYKNYVDISVAVATKTGLLVPVVRDCEKKSLFELEKDLSAIAEKARKGKMTLDDMAGGTSAISNGGIYGSLFGTPILNPPQATILGLHAIKERPVVVDHEIKILPMMYLAMTYDHRLLDGKDAVIFLNKIKEKIENPRVCLGEI